MIDYFKIIFRHVIIRFHTKKRMGWCLQFYLFIVMDKNMLLNLIQKAVNNGAVKEKMLNEISYVIACSTSTYCIL